MSTSPLQSGITPFTHVDTQRRSNKLVTSMTPPGSSVHRPALVHLFTSAKSFSLQPNSHRRFTAWRSRQILGWYSEDGWTLWAPVESRLASSRRWCSWEDPEGAPEWPGTGARAETAQFHPNYSLGTLLVWQTLAQYIHFMFKLDHTHSKKNGDLKVVWEKKKSIWESWILCKLCCWQWPFQCQITARLPNFSQGNCWSKRSKPVNVTNLRHCTLVVASLIFHIYLAFLKSG